MGLIMTKDDKQSDIKSLEDHHYYLFHQDFNSDSCSNAIKFILERNLMKTPPKFMKMIFNSPGGELQSAFSLIDVMKGSKVPIYTYGLGQISSCGLLAFISGKKGHRYVSENTSILSHQFSWFTFGKEYELMAAQREVSHTSKRMLEHYIRCTGLSEKDVKKYLLPPEDVWLSAKEAVKYGIADEIVDFY
jgi:ATP-dependent Clp protease protease subunit